MKRAIVAVTAFLFAGVPLLLAASSARAGGDLCPMGGMLLEVEVDRENALEWLEDGRRAFLESEEEEDDWWYKFESESKGEVAMVLTEEYVFFGVAGRRERESVSQRDLDRVFANDLRTLRRVVQQEVKDLRRGRVIDVRGGDVQAISDAAGIGTLYPARKGPRSSGQSRSRASGVTEEPFPSDGWALHTERCTGEAVNLRDLD